MKKAFAVSLAFMLCLSAVALADEANQSKSQAMGKKLEGTISKVDADNKTITVRESSGTESTIFWDESTQRSGELKEGASVQLTFADKDGKKMATRIDAKAPGKTY